MEIKVIIDPMNERAELPWLAAIPAFSEFETPDELLDALLNDDADSYDGSESPKSSASSGSSAISQRLLPASVTTNNKRTDQPAKKRKRTKFKRPKEEIDQLRRSVGDLENLLALSHQRRQLSSHNPRESIIESVSHSNGVAWMDVASRQYKYLRASRVTNDQLRSQVHHQLNIIQRLVRLVESARRGLPTQIVEPTIDYFDEERYIVKRFELLERARKMHDEIDLVVRDTNFVPVGHEQSETIYFRENASDIEAGATLATGWVRRCVPHSVSAVSDSVCPIEPAHGLSKDAFQMQFIEQSVDRQIAQFCVRFSTRTDPVTLFGLAVRLRFRGDSRHTVIGTSSIWPSPANVAPWSGVGTDTQKWLVVQENSGTSIDVQTDALMKIQISKPAHLRPASGRAETSLLQEFAAASVSHNVDELHRHLDRLLLGKAFALTQ